MGATLRGRNEIDVGLGDDLTALWQPLYGPVHRLGFSLEMRPEGRLGDDRKIDRGVREIVGNAILIVPLGLLFFLLVGQSDFEAGAEYRLGTECVAQLG